MSGDDQRDRVSLTNQPLFDDDISALDTVHALAQYLREQGI